jgi:hypothetical protein
VNLVNQVDFRTLGERNYIEESLAKGKNMSEAPRQFVFNEISASASGTFGALRVLVREVSRFADEHDKGTISSFMSTMRSIFPDAHFGKVSEEDSSAEARESPARKPEPEAGKDRPEAILKDPAKLDLLLKAAQSFVRGSPIQGQLTRQGALVTLVSHFERELAELIHAYYERYPQALPATDRTLTLADLRLLGSVPEAEKLIVGKEVDSVLRESLEEQLCYFKKRLKIDVASISRYQASLVELSQRRNLYVHNQGKVNRKR